MIKLTLHSYKLNIEHNIKFTHPVSDNKVCFVTQNLYKTVLLAIFTVLLMSLVPVLVKAISANEITIGIVRLAIGAAGIAVLARMKHQALFVKANLKWLALLGLIFAGHWYTYFTGLKLSTASLGAIGVCTFGVHLLFLNRIFFKEAIGRVDVLAIILAILGVWLATPDSNITPDQYIGFLTAILSGFLYACLPIINRKATHLSTEQKAFGQFGFGLLFFIGFFPFGNWQLSALDWGGLVFLGLVCTLVAHTLWIKVSTELPNSITATVYYFYVPVAMLQSWLFLDEQLTWQKLTGAALIIAANIMVVLLHRRKKAQ